MPDKKVVKLQELAAEEVPVAFKAENYFDFGANPFEHQQLFDQTKDIIEALASIGDYAKDWLERTIDARLGQADASRQVYRDSVPSGIGQGRFEIIVESGAVFDPAVVVGSSGERGRVYVAAGASVIGVNLWVGDGDIYIGPETGLRGRR